MSTPEKPSWAEQFLRPNLTTKAIAAAEKAAAAAAAKAAANAAAKAAANAEAEAIAESNKVIGLGRNIYGVRGGGRKSRKQRRSKSKTKSKSRTRKA
jgi:hypothetical protein